MKNNNGQKLQWIFFIARRFGSADSHGRSALTSLFSVLGIAFGVMALIVILSVINGFQRGYIESILEVSSAHVRLQGPPEQIEKIRNMAEVNSLTVFRESQTLMQGKYSRQQGVLLRSLPENILDSDTDFASQMEITAGNFDLSSQSSIVLGFELARVLSVSVGDTVSLIAVSGDSSTDLFPENATLTVQGLFRTGYYAIDNAYAFISNQNEIIPAVQDSRPKALVKLYNLNDDERFISTLEKDYPDVSAESWRSFNRSFFGALRVEKNMLLLLVVLIFVVVTVNIYNAMRRTVFERREEIIVLTALGGSSKQVQSIFLTSGLSIGLSGSVLGLLAGLLLSVRINEVFVLAENIVNGINDFISALLFTGTDSAFTLFSPEYFYMNEIPVRILFPEVLFVFIFGVFSATAASWLASQAIIKLKPAEVLRYE